MTVLKKHSQEDIYFQNREFVCMITAITNLEFLIQQSDDKMSNYHSMLNYFYDDFFPKAAVVVKNAKILIFSSHATVFWQTNLCFPKHKESDSER